MAICKICAFSVFIQLALQLEDNNAVSGSQRINKCQTQLREHQIKECLTKLYPSTKAELHQNYTSNYENRSDVSICLRMRRKEFIKEFNKYKVFLQEWKFAVWTFLSNINKTLGKNAVDDMKICSADLEHYIHLSQEFNKILAIESLTKNFTSITPLVVNNSQRTLQGFKTLLFLVEKLYNMTINHIILQNTSSTVKDMFAQYTSVSIGDLRLLEAAYELNLYDIQLATKMHEEAKTLVEFKEKNRLQSAFNTELTRKLLDVEYWENKLQGKRNISEVYERVITEERFRIPLQHYVQPIIYGIIFVFGFVGNTVLVIVITRHRNMRTTSNLLLFNLAVSDMINLLLNIPLLHMQFMTIQWQLGEAMCKMYRFARHMSIAVNIYSVVIISVQKYIVLYRLSRVRHVPTTSTLKTIITVSSAWLIGCVLGIPHSIYAGIYKQICYGYHDDIKIWYLKAVSLFDLIMFCTIPVITICVFSTLSSKILKDSVAIVPSQTTSRAKCIRNRLITSKVFTAITVVSAISYVPNYCFFFYLAWVLEDVIDPKLKHSAFFVVYMLVFGNSCFNSIALCITCRKIRSGFKRYLLCQDDGIIDMNRNQNKTYATT